MGPTKPPLAALTVGGSFYANLRNYTFATCGVISKLRELLSDWLEQVRQAAKI